MKLSQHQEHGCSENQYGGGGPEVTIGKNSSQQ
jgi:hypothetical protein